MAGKTEPENTMKPNALMKIGAISLTLVVLATAGPVQAETLRIGGTGVALGGMRILGAAFAKQHPGTTVEVLPSLGSSGGVKALIAGALDLAVSSRELKEPEQAEGAVARLYATTPLAVVTAADTVADAVTTQDLIDMYAGKLLTWPSGEQVRVVLRPQSETDTQILRGLSDAMARAVDDALMRPGLVSATNDQENAETLEHLPGSVGLVAIGQIATEGRKLKVLALDGVLPSTDSPDERHKRFVKSLYIVNTDAMSGPASEFLEFVFSTEGQAILVSHDHAPVR